MSEERRQPDPHRRGTVYRSRPRLWPRRGSADGRPPSLRPKRPSTDPAGQAPGPADAYPNAHPNAYPDAHPNAYPDTYRDGHGAAPGGRGPRLPGRAHPRGFGVLPRPGGRRLRARWVVLALVALLVLYPLALFWVAWGNLGKVAAMPTGTRPADTPGRTYLVVGSDSRSALTPAERSRLRTGKAVGSRTDTIMLLHVPDDGPTVLMSVPRDSYVSIPGHGKNKINAAFAFGGPQLLVRTIENATGLHIDEYVETGLLGYADLVDAVGGVDVCVKRAMNDSGAHINLKPGCQTFDGKTALGYARARYSDPRGDLGRVERQRQILAAIANKTLSPSVVLLPWRSFPAASAGAGALTVDDGTSPWGLLSFILAMRDVAGGSGLSLTVPIGNPNLNTPVGSAVSWDTAKAKSLFDALRRNDTEAVRPLAEAQKKVTGG